MKQVCAHMEYERGEHKMRRKVSLSMAMLLIAALLCSTVALADRSADQGIVDDDDINVPPVEVPSAVIPVEARVEEDGTAVAEVTSGDLLAAVNKVREEGAVRITVPIAGGESAGGAAATFPKDALQAIVDQTSAELRVESAAGQVTLPHDALASVIEAAGGDSVRVTVSAQGQSPDSGAGAAQDVPDAVIEVSITSGNAAVTELSRGLATISMPVGEAFQEGTSHNVYRTGANGGGQTLVGRCVVADGQPRVELESGSLGTFAAQPGVVAGDTAPAASNMVLSPLAARAEAGSGAFPLFASVRQWCDTAVKRLLQLLGV